MECWLRPNRRALFIAGIPFALVMLLGIPVLFAITPLIRWLGLLLIGLGGVGLAATLWALLLPRVAYHDGRLLLYLRRAQPVSVPIEVVECFFLGQGPSGLASDAAGEQLESRNVVVRLAERATEWQHGQLDRKLGHWCDGYITINGSWCEPINADVVGALNHKLVVAQRKRRARAETEAKTE